MVRLWPLFSTQLTTDSAWSMVSSWRASEISTDDVPAQLQYIATPDGVQLAWNFVINQPGGKHWYNTNVSTVDGSMLFTKDYVAYFVDPNLKLNFGDGSYVAPTTPLPGTTGHAPQSASYSANYDVYARPGLSPSSGPRTNQLNPWDLASSQFGWQDENGTSGGDSNQPRGVRMSLRPSPFTS